MNYIFGDCPDKFSIIVPTFNEEQTIIECIKQIRRNGTDTEIVVADGGSTDLTVDMGLKQGVVVCRSPKGRGRQCNKGAAVASGNVFIFLHADTKLPVGALGKLGKIFQDSRVQIGSFHLAFDSRHWLLKLSSFAVSHFDPGIFRFGDQCIVVRKSFFISLGGFPPYSLFEDISLIRKARKVTKIHHFPMTVIASARRYKRNGVIRQQLRNLYYIILYLFGVSPIKLAEKYYRSESSGKAVLGIMTKLPRSGKVKTRLAEALGDRAAAEFYRMCVEHTIRIVRQLPGSISKYIFYYAKGDEAAIKLWIRSGFLFESQSSGNLGKRLISAFAALFRQGAGRAIFIASDVPDLSAAIINNAFQALDTYDVVIGPSCDGGYYLIGLKKATPKLFQGIAWSTGVVLAQTLDIAKSLDLNIFKLPALIDIDTIEDLRDWGKGAPHGHMLSGFMRNLRTGDLDDGK